MRYLTPFIRVSLSVFEFILGFLSLYFLLFVLGMLIPTGELSEKGSLSIYVTSNGVHTDICLPVKCNEMDWHDFISPDNFSSITPNHYVSIGWGDQGFYLDTPSWDDLTLSTAINAAFLPSKTAMHVTYLNGIPKESERCKKVMINNHQYQKLVDYIQNSFHSIAGQIVLIPEKGYWDNDNFYEANGSYHLFNTCNTWTNTALKEAGIRTPAYALSAEGILWWL